MSRLPGRLAGAAGVLFVAVFHLHAQEASFEVISIRPRQDNSPALYSPQGPDRFVRPDTTVAQLIQYAYDKADFQVLGGPDWIRSRRFEVSAKAAEATPTGRMRLMVRRLLADRFGLKTRTETRENSTYRLVMATRDRKLGDRIRASTIDCEKLLDEGEVTPPSPGGPPPRCLWRIAVMATSARMSVDGVSIPRFAKLLEPMLRRPVVDATGLSGTYDINLEFLPEQAGLPPVASSGQADAPARDGLSLSTALREQLGFNLESRRGPLELIVVEKITPPTPD